MEPREYAAMARLESTLWWYRALHDKVLLALSAAVGTSDDFRLLDVGCGTGGLLRKLEVAFPRASLSGIDISSHAVDFARGNTRADITLASVMDIPYVSSRFDVVTSMDVLYHRDVDQQRMLEECARVLRPGGTLILNVPAYEWLRSYHDRYVATARRYTIASVDRAVRAYPFERVYSTYWNAVLFLPLVIRRKLFPIGSGSSDVTDIPGWLNSAFYGAARCENPLVRAKLRIPFGSSVLATYRRLPTF
jgi:ubiquinone/menaquinone biosynthesis C-methylase UbiE